MYQGETITTTISGFPIPISEIADLTIIFKNNSKVLLQKTLKDCEIQGEELSFKCSQQESLSLSVGKVSRSVVIITKDGTRMESNPSYIVIGQTVRNEVLL